MATDQRKSAYHHGDLRRSLVEAALALVTEEQNWGFSLREVARRAGVSHNAPYNHFADKRALLGAVAEAGYEALRRRMQAAKAGIASPGEALVAIGEAYVRFGIENPAHYRLMFGPELIACPDGPPPDPVMNAAMASKSVLAEVIAWGVDTGEFRADRKDIAAIGTLVLSAWSLVHGLTMLSVDGLAGIALAAEAPRHVAHALLYGVSKRAPAG